MEEKTYGSYNTQNKLVPCPNEFRSTADTFNIPVIGLPIIILQVAEFRISSEVKCVHHILMFAITDVNVLFQEIENRFPKGRV